MSSNETAVIVALSLIILVNWSAIITMASLLFDFGSGPVKTSNRKELWLKALVDFGCTHIRIDK